MTTSFDGYSYVKLEDTAFFPGDDLIGVLHLHVLKPIHAMQLFICITAKESTEWYKSEYDDSRYSGSQVVLQHCLLIHNFNSVVDLGQYRFPFNMKLPLNALPSFCYERSTKAYRNYTVKARLQNATNFNANKTSIWVTSIPNDIKSIYPISSNLVIEIKRRLFGKHVSHVHLTLDKNTYFIDEIITGTLRIDQTNCRRKFIKMNYGLMMTIKVSDNRMHTSVITRPLVSKDRMIKPKHSGVMNVHEFDIDLSSVRDLWKKPTWNSILIECTYAVRVVMIYHGFLSETTHYATLPVEIVNTSRYLSRSQSRAMSEI